MQTFKLTAKQCEIRDLCASHKRNILAFGGSRSGKTLAFCYAIATRAIKAPKSRHVIFRRHGVAVKQSIGKDTFPKMMELAYPGVPYKWHEQDGYFKFWNGSEVWLAGLDDKERVDKVLGREFATLYFNEASEIPLASYNVAQTRLAQQVKQISEKRLALKCYVDLNPTTQSHWTYRLFVEGINPEGETAVDMDDYAHITVNPLDNIENLSADYIKALRSLPERQRKRFFLGEYSGDSEYALWRREYIKRTQKLPEFRRVVVAVDPAVSNEVGSDETGIIVCALSSENNGYILDDLSGKHRPEEWARLVISAYQLYSADRVVAEINQGGDLVEQTIKSQGLNIPFTHVRATRGKVTRAEPIAALYEQGRVFHVKEFQDLEAQMCNFTIGFDRKAQGYSPDRVDALVWGLTDLFPQIIKRGRTKPAHRQKKQRFF